jgi:hypothetical protein
MGQTTCGRAHVGTREGSMAMEAAGEALSPASSPALARFALQIAGRRQLLQAKKAQLEKVKKLIAAF